MDIRVDLLQSVHTTDFELAVREEALVFQDFFHVFVRVYPHLLSLDVELFALSTDLVILFQHFLGTNFGR
jgi:hypothetical protein